MQNLVTVTSAVSTPSTNPISRRAELKTLSNLLKATALENQTSINAALVFFYSEQTGVTSQDFKTLEEWNRTPFYGGPLCQHTRKSTFKVECPPVT